MPVIMAGDFNARQNSASMSLLHLEENIEVLDGSNRWSKDVTRDLEGFMNIYHYTYFD